MGEHVQVKVLKLDREKEKVSLGYKQLLPDPWSTVIEVYPVNAKVKGGLVVTEYGVFVELEPGVEGLVHVSEISWSKRSASPKRMFNRGDEVDVQVLGVDTVEKRISLGMKQFQDNPWDTVDETLSGRHQDPRQGAKSYRFWGVCRARRRHRRPRPCFGHYLGKKDQAS